MTRTRVSPPGPRSKTVDTTDEDGWPVLAPTLLTIERTSPEDVKVRQIIVSLDGKKIGTLLHGQRLTTEIPPGRHTLRANNTLVWRTVAFDAEPGDRALHLRESRTRQPLLHAVPVRGCATLRDARARLKFVIRHSSFVIRTSLS